MSRVNLALAFLAVVLFAHAQAPTSATARALGLGKYLKAWILRTPSHQLDALLSGSTSARDLAANMDVVLDFVHDEKRDNRALRPQLFEAAERLASLRSICAGSCDPGNTQALESVREMLARDFGGAARLASDPGVSSRRLVRVFQEALRTHVRTCLSRFQHEWAQVGDVAQEILGSERAVERTLDKLQEVFRELMCTHAYKGGRLAVNAFECALARRDQSLASKQAAWDVFQVLEAVQLTRDGEQQAQAQGQANLQKLHQAAKPEEIDALLESSLRHACQVFVDNARVQSSLARVPDIVALAPLADELLPEGAGQATDRLLDWTGRLLVCKRLLERTDRATLNANVLEWVESRRAREAEPSAAAAAA